MTTRLSGAAARPESPTGVFGRAISGLCFPAFSPIQPAIAPLGVLLGRSRKDSMTYTLTTHDGYYFWTGASRDNRQLLIGLDVPSIVIYSFGKDGLLVARDTRKIAGIVQQSPFSLDADFFKRFHESLDAIMAEVGFVEGPINIQAFYDDEFNAGILSLPGEYEEFLESPEAFDEVERTRFQAAINDWKEKGNFVFVWGEQLYMKPSGEVESHT
jgi:hypothetical protein